MKSYPIQHDFLFVSSELAVDGFAHFDHCRGTRDRKEAIPLRLSTVLANDGERMLDAYLKRGRTILFQDDVNESSNPILAEYKTILLRGLIAKVHEAGGRIFL